MATAAAMSFVGDLTGSLGLDGVLDKDLGGHGPLGFLSEAHVFNIAGHAAVGCASSVASGGKCGSGALSGAVGSFTTPLAEGAGFGAGLVITSTAGGLASVAGGGKFGNGAVTAAFGYLFNRALKARPITERSDDRYIRQFELDEAAGEKGGVVIQGMEIVETQKGGKRTPDSWLEAFPVERGTKEAFPADTWEMGLCCEAVTMRGSAIYYDGMTEQDLRDLGFSSGKSGGNPHAGSLYSFTIDEKHPAPSFSGYTGTNTETDTWQWPQ